ncbi:MAG: hypothetical protein KDJ16_03270 [Hyphomicrobiales bacterium]|nr:hypothetical protein [Hyphomicrobiales bacterium]
MAEKPALPARRVVVEFGPGEQPERLLDAAARLASAVRADLSGLFIEDSALLDLAGLPFARALAPRPQPARSLRRPDMEAMYAALARRCQRDLEIAAKAARLGWTFEVLRGERHAILQSAGAGADFVVVSTEAECQIGIDPFHSARQAASGVAGVVVVHKAMRATARGPVVILDGDDKAAESIRAIAADLAAAQSVPLNIVAASADIGDIVAELERLRPSFVVADIEAPLFAEDPSIRRIARAASAPVLLIRPQA